MKNAINQDTSFVADMLPHDCNHSTVNLLISIKNDYTKNRFTSVDGNSMKEILMFLGASSKDLIDLEHSGNYLADDPTLPFRKARNGRFLIDFKKNNISRLEFQPFVLSKEEDFIRDDSGLLRNFRGIQDAVQQNTAFQALLKFQAFMIGDIEVIKRPNLIDDCEKWVSTVFQLRTITDGEIIGEPAKEGVHSDGVEHTMTALLYTQNITKGSAISEIHNQNQKTGISWNAVDKKHIIGTFQHTHFLDTLLIIDNELKHSVSDVNSVDKNNRTFRDMLIFFTRRPTTISHSTFPYDSLNHHMEIPLTFTINNH